ncbi:tripartite motif-containing protein 2-like [Amphibalanus amphitrite]|uniref:tripartite motif-containing protein 2-like n=1 Tax=Amphibalanus amphitrite TaxID=1232801 RepID=UPI001C921DD2|nr:tripartite motif-containing protein 2-like [Amphibalanus amphitrite]
MEAGEAPHTNGHRATAAENGLSGGGLQGRDNGPAPGTGTGPVRRVTIADGPPAVSGASDGASDGRSDGASDGIGRGSVSPPVVKPAMKPKPVMRPTVTAGDAVTTGDSVAVSDGVTGRSVSGTVSGQTSNTDTDRPALRCAICGQHFRNPKILPCLHTFCQHCLRRHVPPESLSVSCPSCKCHSILPPAGVSGLQTNRLLALEPDSCTACAGTGTCPTCVAVAAEESRNPAKESSDSDSDSGSESESDVTQESSRRRRGADWQLYCSNHAGQTLRFFCRDCETAVCASCTDILHAQHSTCRLSETGAEQRQALLALRQRVSSQMDVERRRRALLSAAGGQLRQARLQAEQDLQAYCHSLVQTVHRRKEALTGLLAQIYRDRVSDIEHQLVRLDSFLTELDACERHMERALDSGTDTEVLLLNKQVTVRVGGQQLQQQRQQADAEHAGELRFEASNTDRLEAQLASFGSFHAGPDPPEPAALVPQSETDGGATGRPPGDQLLLDIPARLSHSGGHSPGQTHSHSPSQSHSHSPSQSHSHSPGQSHSHGPSQAHRQSPSQIHGHSPSQIHGHSHSQIHRHSLSHAPGQLHSQGHSPAQLHRHSVSHSPGQLRVQRHSPSQAHRHSVSHSPQLHSHSPSQSHSQGSSHSPSPGQSNGHCQLPSSDVSSERSSAERVPARRSLSGSAASPSVISTGSRGSGVSQPSSRRSSRRSVPPPMPPAEDDLVLSIGEKGRGRGEFSNPQGVCYVAAADRLLVADSNNQCVQVFSAEGECKLRFGVRGRAAGQMQRPCGVASTPDGNYVVSDYENRCLCVFDPLGKLVRRIGHGKLQGPKGVTTDRRGNLLVVDNRGSAVVTFSTGGRLLARFGSRGTAQHQFAGPHYVAVDSQDRVVVTDFHNHSVKVFNADGKHLFSFGGNGEAPGQFNAPTGVTTDRYDNILVADWGNSRIQVFDNTGRYLSIVNTGATPLYGPQGLAMSPQGHVIVADTGNHAIKFYTYHPLAA